MSKTIMKNLRQTLDPKRLELQRPFKRVMGLTEDEWNERVRLARNREGIWNNPDIIGKYQERMSDFYDNR